MISVHSRGSFRHVEDFLGRMKRRDHLSKLSKWGPIGVTALSAATPVDSAETSKSWYYEVVDRPGYFAIHWYNSNVEDPGRIPVAVLIQYGHGTKSGAWVEGFDYINPAMRPIFEQIAEEMWKEVTK